MTGRSQTKQAAVTVVFGDHAERLDETFISFRINPFLELHAFILGTELPKRRVPGVAYHLRKPDPSFSHPIRDADFRRWLFIDELDADYALVVDGCDVFCLQPIPEIPELLKGGWLAAATEHPGGRYLEGKVYTGNFLNAGVTFWDVRASRPLREEIVARGRIRFRNCVDDQLALNEVVFARYLDKLTILPCVYNYRAYYRRKVWGWPTTHTFDGVRIYHHDEWRKAREALPVAPHPPLAPLKPDRGPLPRWKQLWRRLLQRCQPHRIR
ncbi:MAG: hypothetical protein J7M29_05815 [Verrucomicrobia bacterium]|nr:hypothetical protein [Verrucomicrobiota bacterium]